MAVDTNILFQLGKGVTPLLSPADIQDQKMQREVNNLKLNALRQSAADDTAQREILRTTTPDMVPNALFQAGLGKQGLDWQKAQADQRKTNAEAMKAQVEQHLKNYEIAGQIMNGVVDQPTWDRARQETARVFGPEAAAQMPAQYDPALIEQRRAQAMTVKQQLEQKWKEMEYTTPTANAVLQANTSAANNAATVANSRRTADMVDARARENNANGRVPSGYRQTPDGSLEFIPGGPADPAAAKKAAPTEFQGKSAIFGARAQEADRILSSLGTDFSAAGINTKNALGNTPLVGGALEAGANLALSENSQKAEQAQRDFINAVLRLESGAAIGKDEFANAKKQYFPQPGDSQAVIEQKAANRKIQIQGLLGNAGNAPIPQSAAAPAPTGLKKKATGTTKTVDIGGVQMQAKQAPDGKFYVQQGNKWFEVKE